MGLISPIPTHDTNYGNREWYHETETQGGEEEAVSEATPIAEDGPIARGRASEGHAHSSTLVPEVKRGHAQHLGRARSPRGRVGGEVGWDTGWFSGSVPG